MRKIILYKLNPDGTIPDFIDEGGFYPTQNAKWQDMILVGITILNYDQVPIQEFVTKNDLQVYLQNTFAELQVPDFTTGEKKPFDPVSAANYLWAKL
jgi:hypothetical protein